MNNPANPRWLLVLGMHRSGTSAITRGLLALGVNLGDHLMEPVPDVNAKGFWEDMDVFRLNDEMLHALDTDWYHSTPLTTQQIKSLRDQGFLQKAGDLLQNKATLASLFGCKDPRLCRLLAFWQAVMADRGDEAAYLVALRNPVCIADSLQKRDGIDRTQSYLMWLSHTLNAVSLSSGHLRVLVELDRVLQAPLQQLHRIAQTFGLSVDEDAAHLYAQDFLDKELRHNRHNLSDLARDPACPALVLKVYRILRRVAADQYSWDTPLFQKQLIYWQKQLEQLRPFMACIDRLQDGRFQP